MRLSLSDRRVALVALGSRLVTCALAGMLGWAVLDYDSSAEFPFPSKARKPFTWLVWDTVFYDRIATTGYEYEQYLAFLPLMPGVLRLAKFLADCFRAAATAGGDATHPAGVPALITAAGLLVSNAAFVVSAVLLHRLSLAVLQDKRLADLSTLFYSFTPASIFHSALYTESLFGALTLAGCCCLYCTPRPRPWLAAPFFALSAATRSNGVVNCGFLLHQAAVSTISSHTWAARCREVAQALAGSVLVALPFVLFQRHGYQLFCGGGAYKGHPRPWCAARVPYPYGYVQQQYWGVGFLRYWQLKQQVPNFLLAAPVLAVAIVFVADYARADLQRFLTGGLAPSPHGAPAAERPAWAASRRAAYKRRVPGAASTAAQGADMQLSDGAAVFVFHLLFLCLVAATTMHVQVATRFLSSSPALYWAMAHLHAANRGHFWLWGYCFLYLSLGCLLFTNFYPWT